MAKYCPNCGLGISDQIKYCPECGADINSLLESSGNLPSRSKSLTKRKNRDFSLEIIVCFIVLFLGVGLIYCVEYYPIGQVLNQDVTISQVNKICETIDQVPVVNAITRQDCDSYENLYSWGTTLGYLFIVVGLISPFVVLYQHRKLR